MNTEIDLDIDAFIPERYIRNEMQKLDIYKRISGIQNEEEYDDMLEELMDRFGELPKCCAESPARLPGCVHRRMTFI